MASWNRDQPFPFTLGKGHVIPGWDAGVVGMKVGGRPQADDPVGDGVRRARCRRRDQAARAAGVRRRSALRGLRQLREPARSPASRPSRGGGSTKSQASKAWRKCAAGRAPMTRLLRLAVLEQDHGRDREHLVARCRDRVVVDVELDELDLLRLAGELLQHGRDRVAGAAPGGPEVDHDRLARLEDVLLEARVGDVAHRRPGYRRPRGRGAAAAAPSRPPRRRSPCSSSSGRAHGR